MLHLKFIPVLLALFFTGSKYVRHATLPADTAAHPFYVSVTEIEQNTRDNILEISCRIFTDDFEKTLRMHYQGAAIDLLNPGKTEAMNVMIRDYVKKHLEIRVDDKAAPLQFVGYEPAEEAVQCYFQVNSADVKKSISVFNNLLFEYKPQQTNIIHVTVRNTRKSIQLANPDARARFEF